MPNRPPLRSRLVAALAKRTLLASSSASLRSSAVRSGARLNINGLVYHRRKALGLPSLPGAATLLSAVSPGLVAVATRLHGAPPAREALGDRRYYCGIGLRLPPRRPPLGLWSAIAFAVLALVLVVVFMRHSSRRQPEI